MAYYIFEDFKKACVEDQMNVFVFPPALNNARNDFNLKTQKELLGFIYNDGLENLSFQNTKLWEKNPDKENPIQIDAYTFRTGIKYAYIAFMQNKEKTKWLIKSFKLSDEESMCYPAFLDAFKKAELLSKEEDDE